ncbi:LOW QUALITY PROTEIN: hypothetical protein V1477_006730, partial [Vespula maculifrons]
KKHCSLRIFLSETIAPRRTERGSLERARRALYAYIFFVQIGPIGAEWNKGKKNFSFAIFFSETIAPRRTGPGSLERARRALYAHIFFDQIGTKVGDTYENRTRVTGKASSRPLRPYFFRTGWTNRSRVITVYRIFLSQTIAPRRTGPGSFERARRALYAHIFLHLGEPDWGHWKELVAPSTPIFSSTRSVQNTYENRTRVTGKGSSRPLRPYFFRTGWTNRSRVITVYRIFLSQTIAPRRTGPVSLERARRGLYAHIFFVQVGPIGAEKKKFFFNKFFSETIAPRRTGPGSFERAHRALYAHIFLVQIGPIGAEIFLSQTIAPRRTGPGSFERARRGLYAHIFFDQIGPKVAENKGKKHCSLRISLSETIAPRRTGPGSFERARRALYAHIFFDQIGPKVAEKKHFSLTIFFSETIVPTRTGLGSLERAPRALYAHIFCVQIGPKVAEIFLSETIAPRRTERGSLERARRALYAYIFFVQIGPIGAEWNKGQKNFSFAIFFSETIAPRRTGPGSFERARRALYAHIFFVQIGPIGAELLQFKDNKGKKHFYLRIFLSETIAPRRTGPRSIFLSETIGPRRTLRGSLERARQALYAHIFFVQIGTIGAEGSKGKKNFSFTIFFSETIAPRRTGPGSFERARRVLYAHIFCVQIGPIGAEEQRKKNFSLTIFFFGTIAPRRTRLGSSERACRALYAHIFFDQIGPIHLGEPDRGRLKELVASSTHIFFAYRSDEKEPIYNGNKGKKNFSLTIFFSGTKAPRRTRLVSLESARRALYAHIFVIFLSETIAPRRTGPGSFENLTGVIGKGSSSPLRTYFFRPDRNNRSRVITHLGEPDWCHWKVHVAPSTPIFLCTDRTNRSRFKGNKGKKHCSLRIFLSETIAPRRTGPGSFENLTGVIGKGSSSPLRTYFFRPDRNNRSRVITHLGEPDWCHWKVLVAPSTPIFLCTDRTNRSRFKGNKGKKHCSLRIFLSETIAPRRTGPGSRTLRGSLERARQALYEHIFFVQIGTIGAEIFLSETIAPRRTGPGSFENLTGVIGKGSSSPLRTYFFRPDRNNRSRVITHLGEPDWCHWKVLIAPSTPIFLCTDRTNRSRVITV